MSEPWLTLVEEWRLQWMLGAGIADPAGGLRAATAGGTRSDAGFVALSAAAGVADPGARRHPLVHHRRRADHGAGALRGVRHGALDGHFGFVAVAAIAFFAIWSVLSNLLCAVLILTVGPFRLGDVVEIVEAFDKPIVKGRVIDINLLYTTLEEVAEPVTGAIVQVPNSLFFQKAVRRWRGADVQLFNRNLNE